MVLDAEAGQRVIGSQISTYWIGRPGSAKSLGVGQLSESWSSGISCDRYRAGALCPYHLVEFDVLAREVVDRLEADCVDWVALAIVVLPLRRD
jgi:hypothetical protein